MIDQGWCTNINVDRHLVQGQRQGHHQGHILDLPIKGDLRQDVLNQNFDKRHTSSSSESQSRSPSRSRSRKSKGRSRSQKTKRRSRKHHHSSYSDSDTDSSVDRYSSKHGDPRKHPKALRFDGKSNWLSFKKKFDSYRKVMKWSEAESKDYLMWSLEGKALDFFTISASDMEKYSLRKIMKKLEARFGVKELTETSTARFRQASPEAG